MKMQGMLGKMLQAAAIGMISTALCGLAFVIGYRAEKQTAD